MIGSRTRSREIALQVLYSCDREAVTQRAQWEPTLADAECSPEVRAFARELVEGVLADRARIDALIAGAADNWEISRLATVDRNILRVSEGGVSSTVRPRSRRMRSSRPLMKAPDCAVL